MKRRSFLGSIAAALGMGSTVAASEAGSGEPQNANVTIWYYDPDHPRSYMLCLEAANMYSKPFVMKPLRKGEALP